MRNFDTESEITLMLIYTRG